MTTTSPHPTELDPAEEFAEQLVTTLNHAATAVLVSLGHRTGLFATLADLPPSTSAEIAEAAGLDERYVREWLDGLVVGRVVDYDLERATYVLPAARAASLTDRGDNIAPFAQYITMMGSVEDDLVACFREGGGVPYSRFARFHDIMEEDSNSTVLGGLFDHILPLIEGIDGRLTEGIDVLDLGCGRGRALAAMAERFPASSFTGVDLSEDAIGRARVLADERGLDNLAFEVRDLSDFDRTAEANAYDFVTTFDAVHDQVAPDRLLAGIHRTLRLNGVYLMQDIHADSRVEGNLDHPLGPLLYALSVSHCMTVSLAGGGTGLGTMWGRQRADDYLRAAGFTDISVHQLDHDVQNGYWVVRP